MRFKILAGMFFGLGAILRLSLCWANPPSNSFDNYFEPIFLIIESGSIPLKDACFQCYHPPVFPWISAMFGLAAIGLGITVPDLLKALQFLPCLYGILTLCVCFFILKSLNISEFGKLLSFGTICFLPRHIYMSAMNSNDTLSYLLVALCIYLIIKKIDYQFSTLSLLLLSVVVTVTLFVKYTVFVILPTLFAVFISVYLSQTLLPRKKTILLAIMTLLLPITMLSAYCLSNFRCYGSALPWNISMYDPTLDRPRDAAGINFFTFKPWELQNPILAPGKLNSFWTLIYSGMWFDTEPYFVPFLDNNEAWWDQYHSWYLGNGSFPGENPSRTAITKISASGLPLMGLLPLAFIIMGIYLYVSKKWENYIKPTIREKVVLTMFPVLLACNTAGVIALALRLPVYNSMKASYFLNSMPAFIAFMGIGLMLCEKRRKLKWAISSLFGILFTLSTVHVVHVVLSI